MRVLTIINGYSISEDILRFSAQITHRANDLITQMTVIALIKSHPALVAETTIDNIKRQFFGLQASIRICHSLAEIIREAEEGEYDLVITEEKHSSKFMSVIKDSTAIRIAENVPCSVLIFKALAHPINRILLCDSGAENSQAVRQFATLLTDLLDGEQEITVLHVMSQISAGPGVRGKQLRAEIEELIQEHTPEGELLKRDMDVLDQRGVHPTPKVRHGLVVDEILAEAHNGAYDLVVIGAHHQEGWQHFLLDNIAHKIITHIDRSVLVIKSRRPTSFPARHPSVYHPKG